MQTGSTGAAWLFGLAAGAAAAGAWLYRRRQSAYDDDAGADIPISTVQPPANSAFGMHAVPLRDAPSPDDAPLETPQAQPSPMVYILLVVGISIPFWLVGGSRLPLPVQLPTSALMFVSPVIAASILTYRQGGLDGVKALLKRAFDVRRIRHRGWFAAALLLMPLVYLLSYLVMRLTGQPLPEPLLPLPWLPLFFLLYLIPAICEELGWTGYALEPMQRRWGMVGAAIVLGLIWSLWHIIPDLQNGKAADWIFWHRLSAVALRILIVWSYNGSGKSVFAAVLVHTMDNVSVSLFPNYGSHYNPMVNAMIMWLTAGVMMLGWRADMLARGRFTKAARS